MEGNVSEFEAGWNQSLASFLSQIPEGFFLQKLEDSRQPVRYPTDFQYYRGEWRVELQHINGGSLAYAVGSTPQEAMKHACAEALRRKDYADQCYQERKARVEKKK